MYSIVNKGMIHGDVLGHNQFTTFLGCDPAQKCTNVMKFACAVPQNFTNELIFYSLLGHKTICVTVALSSHILHIFWLFFYILSEIKVFISQWLECTHNKQPSRAPVSIVVIVCHV
jgi:hypothetical protein